MIKNNHPDEVIQSMYLEITNIAQGVNIALLAYIVTSEVFISGGWYDFITHFSLALTSLFICVLFWIRYYLDTRILYRSFTVLSVIWYFLYITFQGISITFINQPVAWLVSTGFFLLFGAGFYQLNLNEIKRKKAFQVLEALPEYEAWQKRRLVELSVMAFVSFAGAWLVKYGLLPYLLASWVALAASIWQLVLCRDYRKLNFINTGV